jgi:mRNA-degrading endonuclease RelE of RelBE toxin-antitoxin system
MATVRLTPEVQEQALALPLRIQTRVNEKVLEQLRQWPDVSGAKPLRHEWAGHYRKRTGAWRVIFKVIGDVVLVVRIDNRRDAYE